MKMSILAYSVNKDMWKLCPGKGCLQYIYYLWFHQFFLSWPKNKGTLERVKKPSD